jgi:protein gp37
MTLNRTGIEWCDYSYNPVTGCNHWKTGVCKIPCYAKKIAERFHGPGGFIPALHAERLNDPMKKKQPSTIFVCSMADLFGDWVPDLWIEMVFSEIQKAKQHTYIFLTKNPKRYLKIPGTYFSKNLWFGTTVTGVEDTHRIGILQKLPFANKFISFEPLLRDPVSIDLHGIDQIIIGAQTNPKVTPPDGAIGTIVHRAMSSDTTTKIFFKDSLYDDCHYAMRELCWAVHK